jgi:hypothetical protein
MLKHEEVKVSVGGFVVTEIGAEESADFYDETRLEHAGASERKFMIILSRELFVLRVKSWPKGCGDCTNENKRLFFSEFTAKANRLLKDAEIKIKIKREELLKNLLAGATGALKKAE